MGPVIVPTNRTVNRERLHSVPDARKVSGKIKPAKRTILQNLAAHLEIIGEGCPLPLGVILGEVEPETIRQAKIPPVGVCRRTLRRYLIEFSEAGLITMHRDAPESAWVFTLSEEAKRIAKGVK